MIDQAEGPQQPFLNGNQPQPQDQPNQLSGLTQPSQPANISKPQLVAGLHHLDAMQKSLMSVLKAPEAGKSNIRPRLFDAMAILIGNRTMTVPEVINGMKDLPSDPVDQKKWLETKLMQTKQAEQMLVSHYIAQGPGEENPVEWTQDTHHDHMAGLMGNYKRG